MMKMWYVIICILFSCSTATRVIQEKSLRIIVGTTAISPGTRPDSEKCVRNQQLVKNKTTIYESIFTCFGHSPTPTEAPRTAPGISSNSEEHKGNLGEEVSLSCKVLGFKSNDTFMWKRDGDEFPLYIHSRNRPPTVLGQQDKFEFTDSNYSRWEMKIKDIQVTDADVYSCAVRSKRLVDEGGSIFQYFNLTVYYPVTITGVLPRGPPPTPKKLYFNETDNVTISCLSDGVPLPTTFWTRADNRNLQSGEDISIGKNLKIYNISVADEGEYVCHARQVRHNDTYNITIVVQHKPIVRSGKSVIRQERGSMVDLVCHIDSEPLPFTTVWRHVESRRHIREDSKTKGSSRVYITSLDPSTHYGNYTCVVTNDVGTGTCHFEITGRPAKPHITSSPRSNRKGAYLLEWTFKDYEITNKKKFWINYTGEVFKNKDVYLVYHFTLEYNNDKPMSYNRTIYDLKPNATYFLQLYSENEYGKGDVETFMFTTAAVDPTPSPLSPGNPLPNTGQRENDGTWLQASLHSSLLCLVCAFFFWK